MTEFASENEVTKVASTEYTETRELLDEVAAVVEDLEKRLVARNEKIDESDFKLLYSYAQATANRAFDVITKLVTNGLSEADISDFKKYVIKRLNVSLDKIGQLKAEHTAGKHPIVLDALQIPDFISDYLDFRTALFKEKRGGKTDFTDRKDNFRALKVHPSAFFVEGSQKALNKLVGEYPGILDDTAPYQDKAQLSDTEPAALGSVLIDFVDADKIDELTRWLIGAKGTEDNTEAFINLLKLTQSFEGNEPGQIEVPEGLLELGKALKKVLAEKQRLLNEKRISPSINENAPLEKYSLTEARIYELLQIIELITDPARFPQFTTWRDEVIRKHIVYVEGKSETTYEDFLQDVQHKIDTGVKLEDEELKALTQVQGFLQNQQPLIRAVQYPTEPGSKFNEQLKTVKLTYLTAEMERVQQLLDKDDSARNKKNVNAVMAENRGYELEAVNLMYDKVRELNRQMPAFLEAREYVRKNGINKFMEEVVLGLSNYITETLFNATVSTGRQPMGLPKSTVDIWGHEFNVPSREMDVNKTLETFFTSFPWMEVMDGISEDAVTEWVRVWKYRVLHIQSMHNYAREIDATGNWQSPDNPEKIVGVIGTDKGDAGGYFHWDLPYFNKRTYKRDSSSKVQREFYNVFQSSEPEFDGMETYWRMPDLVHYFISGIEREIPDMVFRSRADKKTEFMRVQENLIARIPERFRMRDDDGNYRDDNLIDIAWKVATWQMLVLLRTFDYDDDGLDSKLAWYINTGQYAAKVLHGRPNTDYEWRDTSVELNCVWPTRADFIHMYVELPPDRYVSYTIDEVIAEKKRLEAQMKGATDSAKRSELQKRVSQISRFIIETRQVAVGEFEDIGSLDEIDHLGKRIKQLSELMYDTDAAGRKVPRQPDKIRPADQKEYDRLTYLHSKLTKLKARLEAAGKTSEEVLAAVRREAMNLAVDDRYLLVRVKPEHAMLHDPDNPRDIDEMTFIRVPRSYLEYSQRRADLSGDPARADLIVLSDRQINDSLLDTRYVRYDTITSKHAETWAGVAKDGKIWMDFVKTRDTKAVFPPIHDTHAAKEGIHRKTLMSDFPEDVKAKWRRIRTLGKNPEQLAEEGERLDRELRSRVIITHVTIDDITKKEDGMGFSKITQAGARYYFDKMSTGAGPNLPGEDVQLVTELWLNVFRKPFHGMVESHGHMAPGTIRELRLKYKDAKKLREEKATPVPEGVRVAADIALTVDQEGRSLHQAAQNQLIVESFLIAVGLYLDQYRYKSVEDGHSVPFQADMLETVYKDISTISSAKPMDFAHRELFLKMCDMMLESFLGEEFGGEIGDQDVRLDKKIVRDYGRAAVEQMMRDRGIVGTLEQYVVDTHFYKHDWPKIGEVAQKDKDKH